MGFWDFASYYRQYEELLPFLIEAGGSKFVNHTDEDGKHLGFYLKEKKHLSLLIKVGGPNWIHHKDNNGFGFTL